MRYIQPSALEERKNRVLQAIIHEYIKTGKPVGSQVLCQEYKFDLSTATIRNIMSELEAEGYLTHPHTSAGRIPTDKGYRSYVDSVMDLQRQAIDEENRIRQEYHGKIKELNELLVQTSHVLSAMSHYTGFVISTKLEHDLLKCVELIKISDTQVLAIMVTQAGLVKHTVIASAVSPQMLGYLNSVLNEKLHNCSVLEAKQKIVEQLEQAGEEHKEATSLFRSLSQNMFDMGEELYIEGASRVLTLPEFQDFEPMRCMLKLNDERDLLIRAMENRLGDEGIRVTIGSEDACPELRHVSVITSVYKHGNQPIGVLGIIGPKRMEYSKMMNIVKSVSQIFNKMLSKIGG